MAAPIPETQPAVSTPTAIGSESSSPVSTPSAIPAGAATTPSAPTALTAQPIPAIEKPDTGA